MENKRYYYFRAKTVLTFNLETKQLDIGRDAELCSFITEDLKLMADFLNNCYNYCKTGQDFEDIEVY